MGVNIMKINASAVYALGVLTASLICSIFLLELRPPTGLAAPSSVFQTEFGLTVSSFLLAVVVAQPVKDILASRTSSLSSLMNRKVSLSAPIRAICFLALLASFFLFAFWAVADLLGGYNGYNYSFSTHPLLPLIYHVIGLRFFGSWDVGDQAAFFFLIAISGFFALGINRGIGAALDDSITLFGAPVVATFELALWYFAPADMSWHVTDFLWIGGVDDLGFRAADGAGGGTFLVSNWFVLLISLLLIASRLPLARQLSRILWHHEGKSRCAEDGTGTSLSREEQSPP
jgi:hypothetical protein